MRAAPDRDAGNTLPDTRRSVIADRLSRGVTLSLASLTAEFDVSTDTIRRDLDRLEAQGLARRVRGGAVPAQPAPPLRDRIGRDPPPGLIARAVDRIGECRTLILDGGTTVAALARALPPLKGRLVVTPSPVVAAATCLAGIDTVTLGGPISQSGGIATGSGAEAALRDIHAELAILGACGLDAQSGLSSDEHAESEMKRAMAAASGAVWVLTDRAKIGTRARYGTLSPPQIDLVITDATPADRAAFAAAGIDIHGP